MKLSFDDTQVAFAHKTDADLKKAYRLFQAFSYPFLVNKGPALANMAMSIGLPIKPLIKSTLFHQFCGGETIAESYPSAKQLHDSGIGAILDYSVEGDGNPKDFERTFEELKKVINEAATKPEYPFAVFKPTGLGSATIFTKVTNKDPLAKSEIAAFDIFKKRVGDLCELAHSLDVKLLIDAEESWFQEAIDEVVYANMEKYNTVKTIVFNTAQLYLKGRVEHMERQIEIAKQKGYKSGYKLVRGAYMEKEAERALEKGYANPIQATKEATDNDYNKAVRLCFDNRDMMSVVAGTHNEQSSFLLAQLIDKAGLDKKDDRFWFAQLYGMSDHISFNLAKAGFNVAKYLPYGPVKEVLPYLSRRAQENSSVKGQAGRELSLIMKEMNRRKGI